MFISRVLLLSLFVLGPFHRKLKAREGFASESGKAQRACAVTDEPWAYASLYTKVHLITNFESNINTKC